MAPYSEPSVRGTSGSASGSGRALFCGRPGQRSSGRPLVYMSLCDAQPGVLPEGRLMTDPAVATDQMLPCHNRARSGGEPRGTAVAGGADNSRLGTSTYRRSDHKSPHLAPKAVFRTATHHASVLSNLE